MKRYPFGFHCTDENNEEIVIQFDMKSLIHLSTDKEVHKYTIKNVLYKNNKKKPFGCELAIADNGLQKKLIVYVVDDVITDFSEIRYEQSDDKDLLRCRVNFVNNIL